MPRDPSLDSRLSELVGHFYDAALDDRLWTGVSARIADALGATSTVLKLHATDNRVQLLEMTPNMVVADGLQSWAEHWHSRDLWVQRSVSVGLSHIVTSDDLVSEEEQRRSGFYQEWLRQLDIHHMIGAVFAAEGGGVGVLGVHRPGDGRRFGARDRQATALLLPHLERALRIGQRLSEARFERHAALDALEVLDTGVVIADGRGRVRHASKAAEAMLAASADLTLAGGRLCAPAPALRARLARALAQAVAIAAGQDVTSPTSLRLAREGRPAWSLSISPLSARSALTGWQEPMALILLRDPEYPAVRIDLLRELFGLTQAEAVTASELARGRSLQEIAIALGVGLGTVRTHLKQVLQKTETNRQAQAVAVITRSVAALHAFR